MSDPITNPADAPSDENLVDGRPGNTASDHGERDTALTTDDESQRDEDVVEPDNH